MIKEGEEEGGGVEQRWVHLTRIGGERSAPAGGGTSEPQII